MRFARFAGQRWTGRTVKGMAEIIAEHWIMLLGLFCWIMGYALGYKHGLKDGEGNG